MWHLRTCPEGWLVTSTSWMGVFRISRDYNQNFKKERKKTCTLTYLSPVAHEAWAWLAEDLLTSLILPETCCHLDSQGWSLPGTWTWSWGSCRLALLGILAFWWPEYRPSSLGIGIHYMDKNEQNPIIPKMIESHKAMTARTNAQRTPHVPSL